ncbi:MAG: hypothetical protein ACKVKS_01920 [Candidatus Poseidoniales archaeon]
MGKRKGKKKNAQNPPVSGLPMPALPGMPLPPLHGMPLPSPGALPAPLPAHLPLPSTPAPLPLPGGAAPLPLPELPLPVEQPVESNEYGGMWAKRSDKPLQQIYGHIDRLAKGETGSLLDRYSERFGHSLDREIIVLRKKEHDAKVSEIRDAPVVVLLDDEDSEGLQSQLSVIEDELRTLKPEYQAAKSSGDSELLSQLRPVLEGLMSERKSIMAMMNESSEPTVAEEATHSDATGDDADLFVSFVSIVDDLLGSDLSEEVVTSFIESDEFEIYQEVASNASSADDDLRRQFVGIVDGQLGNMSEDSINAFVQSSNFEIYSTVATLYQSDDS